MNHRPPAPKAGALTKLRYAPSVIYYQEIPVLSQEGILSVIHLSEQERVVIGEVLNVLVMFLCMIAMYLTTV